MIKTSFDIINLYCIVGKEKTRKTNNILKISQPTWMIINKYEIPSFLRISFFIDLMMKYP